MISGSGTRKYIVLQKHSKTLPCPMQASHFLWIGSVFLLVGCVVPSCNRKATSINASIHASIPFSLSISIYLYIIIIYPIYLMDRYHFVLTPLKTEAANILLFNSTKNWTIFQRQSAEPIFCLADQQFWGLGLTEYFVHDHVASLGAFNTQRKKTQTGRIFGSSCGRRSRRPL